jgi:hypothetical protein
VTWTCPGIADEVSLLGLFGLTVFGNTLLRIIVMAAQGGRLTFP